MNHHPHYYSHHPPMDDTTTQRVEDEDDDNDDEDNNNPAKLWTCCHGHVMIRIPTVRQLALSLSLYCNIAITMAKFIAYLQTFSLSVLAAFLDSVLDVVSQLVLNYTEQRSSSLNTHHDHDQQDPDDNTHHHHHHHPNQRSSAYYPAGAARLEPIGVLTCAALMGMASFEVLKQSTISLVYYPTSPKDTSSPPRLSSVLNLLVVLFLKLALYWLCQRGAKKRYVRVEETVKDDEEEETKEKVVDMDKGTSKNEDADTVTPPFTSTNTKVEDVDDSLHPLLLNEKDHDDVPIVTSTAPTPTSTNATTGTTTTVTTVPYPYTATTTTNNNNNNNNNNTVAHARSKHVLQMADPTMEALAQDHFNDCLSNAVAAFALLCNYYSHSQLWFVDPIGAIVISLYIIYSWYMTGKEQIEHLTGRSAPDEFIQEIIDMANDFDERITVDIVRAYHFGPKFLVEIEIVMNATTLLFESHDLGMDLQYEIEGREEVERCFVHIDYQTRPYDEHVVSKVPELREKFNITKQPSVKQMRSTQSI
jgi:cation diffusion facilitator family transporter